MANADEWMVEIQCEWGHRDLASMAAIVIQIEAVMWIVCMCVFVGADVML